MAYIGVQPAEAYTSFAVQHFTTSATTSYTLDNPVANENEIALFINNVRQEPGSSYAYTASGTALTLSAATSASDTMYCVFIGKAVQTVTPAVGSVTNDMLAGSIATSKLADGSTFATTNGITVADQWRLTTNFTGDATPIASNLERVDGAGQGTLGTGMTESSGVFTFPSTGIWYVQFNVYDQHNTGNWYHTIGIDVTTDNSSYSVRAQGEAWGTNAGEPQTFYSSATTNTLVDVTDTTQVKVRFTIDAFSGTATTRGDSNTNLTYMTFIRLGDT